MRWLIRLLWAIAILVAVVAFYPNDPGEVLMRLPGLGTISTTPIVFLLATMAGIALLVLVFRLADWVVRLPWWIPRKIRESRMHRADERLLTGWTWLSTGGYREALRLAEKTYKSGLSNTEAALLAARAEMKLDHYELSGQWLDKVNTTLPRHQLLKDLMRAKLHLHHHEQQAALSVIEKIEKTNGFNSVLGRFRIQAYRQEGNFDQMVQLTQQLLKKELAPQSDIDLWMHQARLGQLTTLSQNDQPMKTKIQGLMQWWKNLERAEQSDPTLISAAFPLLDQCWQEQNPSPQETQTLALEWLDKVIQKLIDGLSENPQADARQFALLSEASDRYAQRALELDNAIARAQQWLAMLKDSSALLRATARLCERRELWGNAIRYYETSLSFENHAPTILRLRSIYQRLGQHDQANVWQSRLIENLHHD